MIFTRKHKHAVRVFEPSHKPMGVYTMNLCFKFKKYIICMNLNWKIVYYSLKL